MFLCVPFYTLVERKILGYIQLRKGPNKVRVFGVLQPIADGVKLILKKGISLLKGNPLFFAGPLTGFCIMVFI